MHKTICNTFFFYCVYISVHRYAHHSLPFRLVLYGRGLLLLAIHFKLPSKRRAITNQNFCSTSPAVRAAHCCFRNSISRKKFPLDFIKHCSGTYFGTYSFFLLHYFWSVPFHLKFLYLGCKL